MHSRFQVIVKAAIARSGSEMEEYKVFVIPGLFDISIAPSIS